MHLEERRAWTSLLTASPSEADISKDLGLQWCRCRRESEVTEKVKRWFPKQPKTDLSNSPLTSFKIKRSADLEALVD